MNKKTKTAVICIFLITGSLNSALAQKKPCIAPEEISVTEKNNALFIDKNMSNLRQTDRDAIARMLDKAVTDPLRHGVTDCSTEGREGVKNEIRSSFTSFYYQIGPGGRQLFDNYEVPMHKGMWLGGSGAQ